MTLAPPHYVNTYMHVHTRRHTPYLISALGLHGNTKQVTVFQRGEDWGTYRRSSCLCLGVRVCVRLCLWMLRCVFCVVGVGCKMWNLAVIVLRLSSVWKGGMMAGHSDRTCQLLLSSAVGRSVLHTIILTLLNNSTHRRTHNTALLLTLHSCSRENISGHASRDRDYLQTIIGWAFINNLWLTDLLFHIHSYR